jgi:hypothetical protein
VECLHGVATCSKLVSHLKTSYFLSENCVVALTGLSDEMEEVD